MFRHEIWKPHRLDELGLVGRGKSRHRPRNDPRLYGGPYPFIQTADIMAADPYITSYSQTYSDLGLQQSKLWPADTLCMTIAGANTAKTAILKIDACFPDSVVGFIPDKAKANLHFVKYSLDLLKSQFLAVSRGATQDNLSLDKLLSFQIPVPPLTLQRRISEILSAYDDLIENVRGRSRVLDQMMMSLYQHWFVHHRFPNHIKGNFMDSPLGRLPAGWEFRAVTDFAEFVRGIEPGADKYVTQPLEGHVRFLRVGDLSKREADIFVPASVIGGKLLKPEDIAITLDGSVGLVRIGLSGAYSTGIRKVQINNSNRLGWAFTYSLLRSDAIQATINAHAKGTTIKHAGTAVEAMRFAAPPTVLIQQFERIAAPMLKETLILQSKEILLRQMRDLVYPRLLSGRLLGSDALVTA